MNALSKAEILAAFPSISRQLDEELERKRLWKRDDDPRCVPFESGPSPKKREAAWPKTPKSEEDHLTSVDSVFTSDVFLEEAPEAREVAGVSIHPHLPLRAVSPLHRLMRPPPGSLKESIARDLFDSFYFLNHEPHDLLPALCFYEVGVETIGHFLYVRRRAYKYGRFHAAGKEFHFDEYHRDKLRLFHQIKKKRKSYFALNRPLLRLAAPSKLETLWDRLDSALKSLTSKQRNAVVQVLIKKKPQSRVAERMRITIDSLRDRLEGAEIKIRAALPELASLAPSKSHQKNKRRRLLHSGLFDSWTADEIAPLYRVDLKTRERTQIAPTKRRKRIGVDREKIRAWAFETTPVPDFGFTDYFAGLISRAALDRMSTFNTVHDRGLSCTSFANKLEKHDEAHSHKRSGTT